MISSVWELCIAEIRREMGWRHCDFKAGWTEFVENRWEGPATEIHSHGVKWKDFTQMHLCGKTSLILQYIALVFM